MEELLTILWWVAFAIVTVVNVVIVQMLISREPTNGNAVYKWLLMTIFVHAIGYVHYFGGGF